MQEAIAQIRTHDTHKLLSAKAAFLRLSPDEKARFAAAARAELKKPRHQRKDLRTSEELQSHLRHLDLSSSLAKKCGGGGSNTGSGALPLSLLTPGAYRSTSAQYWYRYVVPAWCCRSAPWGQCRLAWWYSSPVAPA